MAAESPFAPISSDALRTAKARLAMAGLTVHQWAKREGFSPRLAYQVLSGNRRAIRGESLQIAIALRLRPDPGPHPQPPASVPTGHTVGTGPSVVACDRRPISQLVGEAAR